MPSKQPNLPQASEEEWDPGPWQIGEMAHWLIEAELKGFDVFYPVIWMGKNTQPQVIFWPMSIHIDHHHGVMGA